jgi:two-component system nitrate/nitrite response regulator NarL
MGGLRVLVVADDPLARAGLAALLNAQPACDVVGQVQAGQDLADEVAIYRPDAMVWDLGWEAAGEDPFPELDDVQVPVVVLLADEHLAAQAWVAGARGLLPREVAAEELVAALGAVAGGLIVFDPALAGAIVPVREHLPELAMEELTPRELEVLQLVAEGLSNRAIGLRLEISEHTVKFHVNAILGKLGAQSRTEAVVRATRLGLIML